MRSMKYFIGCLLLATFSVMFSVHARAVSMGVSQGHDLDDLWARAPKLFEYSAHDAVLLLESRRVSILDNGDLVTRVHRVVWISTEVGIYEHADLRIPWNSATSELNVIALRTWMDDTWWPDESEVSETAVVETLPFALALAYDYTSMRETMLLHDGVELPCIMETIYEIEERGGAKNGASGLCVFPQSDPAVLVEFVLSVPSGVTPAFLALNGAPDPAIMSDAGRTTYTWSMENLSRLGSPRISNPAVYAPHVIWSTWKDWEAIGERLTSAFDEAAALSDALADSLEARLEREPDNRAKARAIAGLVNEWTRSVHYGEGFWLFSPRPATRTWETAYGHALDRAALAAALFRAAGFTAEPVYRCMPASGDELAVPTLARFGGIALLVEGLRLSAVFDPAEGTLEHANSWTYGRAVWQPRMGGKLRLPGEGYDNPEFWSRYELILTLEPAEGGGWKGSGYLSADGIFCPYDEMAGLEGETLSYLSRLARSVLPGAEVAGFNPEAFGSFHVTTGFQFTLQELEPDAYGRTRITAGTPAGGIAMHLPPDVHAYDELRSSPVLLAGKQHQKVVLRIETGDREIVYLPEAGELVNEAGRCALTVERSGGWVTVGRQLSLDKAMLSPKEWPLLRALLLEDEDAAGRTILMR
jgi:hypothetical protein